MRRGEQRRDGERGTALIVALMVMIVMTLLGIPFLLMGETESRIAGNERLSLQAQYAAESGALMVKRWFDRPGDAANLVNPPLAAIDRSLRQIDADGNPATAPVQANGSALKPYYKQSDDALFDLPYRGTLEDALLGTPIGPDLRIDAAASSAAASFLEDFSEKLFADYPAAESGQVARIDRIDVFAPPTVLKGGSWTRHGIATVRVTARIYQLRPDGSEVVLAGRTVSAVLNEVAAAYTNGVFGPVRVCEDIEWTQYQLGIRWGLGLAGGDANLGSHTLQTASLPRAEPTSAEVDLLFAWDDDVMWDEFFQDHVVEHFSWEIEDPWFRLAVGGMIDMPGTYNPGGRQPWPYSWDHAQYHLHNQDRGLAKHNNDPSHPIYPACTANHSNLFQSMAVPSCATHPPFPYETWKALALQGGPNVHYFVHVGGDQFRRAGDPNTQSFRALTNGKQGFFFFDTTDGLPPKSDNSNLTPRIELSGGTWGVEGLVYLNAKSFHAHDVVGPDRPYRSPGEPFQDENQSGEWEHGERWVNLDLTGGTFRGDHLDSYGGSVMRNARGPVALEPAMVWGILYLSGDFDSTGNGRYYGSVVTRGGFKELSAVMDAPEIYWDAGLKGDWPPAAWRLPRVLVASWETEL